MKNHCISYPSKIILSNMNYNLDLFWKTWFDPKSVINTMKSAITLFHGAYLRGRVGLGVSLKWASNMQILVWPEETMQTNKYSCFKTCWGVRYELKSVRKTMGIFNNLWIWGLNMINAIIDPIHIYKVPNLEPDWSKYTPFV